MARILDPRRLISESNRVRVYADLVVRPSRGTSSAAPPTSSRDVMTHQVSPGLATSASLTYRSGDAVFATKE
jgi:hypothetical protein